MAQINCADCLKTYRPYRYSIALLRVLMYGFSDWWEFEDERVIEEQFIEKWRDRNVRSGLINKTRTYRNDDSFDFIFYYQYLENKRRKSISANFLCFDCEKYYSIKCVDKHSGHFTFSKDDKNDLSKWGRISVEMLEKLKVEGDFKPEKIRREHTRLLDVVDGRCEHDKPRLHYFLWKLEKYFCDGRYEFRVRDFRPPTIYDDEYYDFRQRGLQFPVIYDNKGIHILNDKTNWLVTDDINNCIKIFNVNNNKMTRYIKLSSSPHSVTEIPSTDPLQCLIAVSFPREKQIHIMNIHSTPAQVVSSINVQGECWDLVYCSNKIITRCYDLHEVDRTLRHSIHVMNISGQIINIIDLHNLPGIKLKRFYPGCMSVNSESETIYVCHWTRPSCVISLSLDGQLLHSATFTDLEPRVIHVDKDQNVYVVSRQLPIYKLSADLRHKYKIIDKDVVDISLITVERFYNVKIYLAPDKRHVYIIQHE